MSKIMLIDAAYREETRVALIDSKSRLVEYDYVTSAKVTSKGNIYLAKVIRVEPSLQAAFIEYGGNRHGFLAFSDIHPDYFRIPISDREALNAQLATAVPEDEFDNADVTQTDAVSEDTSDSSDDGITLDFENSVSTIAGDSVEPLDEVDLVKNNRPPLHRLYKIQEVIHKNQILLVQVVKEERGQKGAALTTYLSLAGRFSVLMTNSPHSGGISRKISNSEDRKRLRKILESLKISDEMGLIIRTAGKDHTKVELKRDADYLTSLWEEIRSDTLKAIAPALIYQEDDIIKRSLRDLYTNDVDEILIEGIEHHKAARDFMKKIMPSHIKKVHHYQNRQQSIFAHYKVEKQIEAMQSPAVQLPSGGSIVLHPTEALVAIDINSGRATRERNIESTALNTNLEAAVEIARQVRLRDLAGLIVIDFIDMDDRRHIQQVEKKIRDAFREDRARVQMSKISPFGLLELSRQRLRPSIHETYSVPCDSCQSTGYVRSIESLSLKILRELTSEAASGRSSKVRVQMPSKVAWHMLNTMRIALTQIEQDHNIVIFIEANAELMIPKYHIIQDQRKVKVTPDDEGEVIAIKSHSDKNARSPNDKQLDKKPSQQNRKAPQASVDHEGQGHRRPMRKSVKSGPEQPIVLVTDTQGDVAADGASAGEEKIKKSTLRNRNNRRRLKERRQLSKQGETKENIDNAIIDVHSGGPRVESAPATELAPVKDKRPPTKQAHHKKISDNPIVNDHTGGPRVESVAAVSAEPDQKSLDQTNNSESHKDTVKTKPKSTKKSWLKKLLDTD